MAVETGIKGALANLTWLPPWGLSLVIFAGAALLALLIHAVLFRILERVTKGRGLFERSFVTRTSWLARFGLLALALGLAAQIAPLTPEATALVSHALQVAVIIFLGWIAMQALHIGAIVYMRRFKLEAEDNLLARRHTTQIRILQRIFGTLIIMVTVAAALMTFPGVRQYGISLLASAGAAGVILGFALQSVFANLMAGVQIALTQPIRIDDAVVVEGEWGWIEEFTSTYVVVRLWDRRRLVVPLKYFMEKPFQNWTRETSSLIGSVFLKVDYSMPIDTMRAHLKEIVRQTKLWDGEILNLQVTDAAEKFIEVRILASAKNAQETWDLRCFIREKMIAVLNERHPESLPRERAGAPGRAAPA